MKINVPYIVKPKDFEAFWSEFEASFPNCQLYRKKQKYLKIIIEDGYGLEVSRDLYDRLHLCTTRGKVEYIGEVEFV